MINRTTDDLPEELRDALLEGIEPVSPNPAQLESVKERLMRRVAAERAMPQPDSKGLVTVHAEDGEWSSFLPNVSIKILRRDKDSQTYLLKLDPGAALLPHEHPQDEECIVLAGEARIGDLTVRAGDYHCALAGRPHGVIQSEKGAVLFLRGAVPAANQVRWLSLGTLTALTAASMRKFVDRL